MNNKNKLYNLYYYFSKSFEDEIANIINNSKNNKKINIFDVGSFMGNFSRNIKKNQKKSKFLFIWSKPKNCIKGFYL